MRDPAQRCVFNMEQSPYTVTDDEFAPVFAKYENMVYWCAHNVARRMGYKKNNEEVVQDIAQEIFLAVARCCQKYKRQAFIIGCYTFFKEHPRVIPCAHFSRVMCALMYWQLRGALGPKHSFSPNHDMFLADAVDAIEDVAPDFRWKPKESVLFYVEAHREDILSALEDSDVLDRYLLAVSEGRRKDKEEYGKKLNDKAHLFSPLGTKPSRFAPLVVDEKFGPLVKRYIINHGNKTMKRRSKIDMVGHVPIEDFAEVIPDTGTMNQFYSSRDDYKRRPCLSGDDEMGLYRNDIAQDEIFATGSVFERSFVIDRGTIDKYVRRVTEAVLAELD